MTLLLSTSDRFGVVWKWPFEPGPGATALGPAAVRALEDAERVARHVVPVTPPRVLGPGMARTKMTSEDVVSGASAVSVLDGASFGLAFALASIAKRLGLPVPADVVATGDLTPDGQVHPVHLGLKLAAARRCPGVTRILLPKANEEEARAMNSALAVHGVRTIAEAVRACWGDAFQPALEDHLSRHAASAADRLFELVLGTPTTFLPWSQIEHAAHAVAAAQEGGDSTWQMEVVTAIAGRHAGKPLALPESIWERLGELRRPLRLRLLAHAIQGVNDAAQEPWRDVAQRACDALNRPGDEDEGDAKVLGALGRLHAGWGEWEAARAHLVRAIETWQELRRASEMSFGVCELLRVEGICGTPDAIDRALDFARQCREHDETVEISQAYLDLAMGRALVQLGVRTGDAARRDAGLATLGACRPGSLLLNTRLRWRAIGGDDSALAALESTSPDALLARMARGEAPRDWSAKLANPLERARAERILGADPDPRAVATIWRY